MNEKDEFFTKLSGPAGYRKILNRLMKQRRLLSLEIEQLVTDAYSHDCLLKSLSEDDINRRYHKGIFQLSIVFESECSKSPYGMHAVSNAHQYHDQCVWCDRITDNNDLEQVYVNN